MISFTIPGRAQPAGSKHAIPYKTKAGKLGVAMRDGTAKSAQRHADWRARVALAAGAAMAGRPPLDCAVRATLTVWFTRPHGHFRANGALNAEGLRKPFPTGYPDCDKLSRAAMDSIKGIVLVDDSRICSLVVFKCYGPRDEVTIEVSALSPDPTAPITA